MLCLPLSQQLTQYRRILYHTRYLEYVVYIRNHAQLNETAKFLACAGMTGAAHGAIAGLNTAGLNTADGRSQSHCAM